MVDHHKVVELPQHALCPRSGKERRGPDLQVIRNRYPAAPYYVKYISIGEFYVRDPDPLNHRQLDGDHMAWSHLFPAPKYLKTSHTCIVILRNRNKFLKKSATFKAPEWRFFTEELYRQRPPRSHTSKVGAVLDALRTSTVKLVVQVKLRHERPELGCRILVCR